jgi:hypothetical protein
MNIPKYQDSQTLIFNNKFMAEKLIFGYWDLRGIA